MDGPQLNLHRCGWLLLTYLSYQLSYRICLPPSWGIPVKVRPPLPHERPLPSLFPLPTIPCNDVQAAFVVVSTSPRWGICAPKALSDSGSAFAKCSLWGIWPSLQLQMPFSFRLNRTMCRVGSSDTFNSGAVLRQVDSSVSS